MHDDHRRQRDAEPRGEHLERAAVARALDEHVVTADGPDLVLGLSDAPSGGAWGSHDDGRLVLLCDLEATHGNHSYAVPHDVDLDGLTTVVLWCDRFDVAFGTATIASS